MTTELVKLKLKTNFSFINETKTASNNVGTLGDCCSEFYVECQTYQMVFPYDNGCHFGYATTNTFNYNPGGASWNVYIKEGTI